MRHLHIATALVVWLGLGACEPPAHVVLRVEDPLELATGADRLEIGSDLDRMTEVSMDGKRFPVTVNLRGRPAGSTLIVWVDALDASGTVMARARTSVFFPHDGRSGTATAVLSAACAASTTEALPCALADEPDATGVCVDGRCTVSTCGDGIIDSTKGETCDDGNLVLTDDCPDGEAGTCRTATCGDGHLQAGVEECDDGNAEDTDFCRADCSPNICGDGAQNQVLVDGVPVEACDDGNQSDDDDCVSGCRAARCGDGFTNRTLRSDGLGPKEACDDGPDEATNSAWSNPNDGCNELCEATVWDADILLGWGDNAGFPELSGGEASTLLLGAVRGLAVAADGNLYIADGASRRVWRWGDHCVRRRGENPEWICTPKTTVAAGRGSAFVSFFSRTTGDAGPAEFATLDTPRGIAVDGSGNLYVADRGQTGASAYDDFAGHRVRRVDVVTHTMTTIAGTGLPGTNTDPGPALAAELSSPLDVAVDGVGNLYIADTGNKVVRRIDHATGVIAPWVGNGSCGAGVFDEGQSRLSTAICQPTAVAVGPDGALYLTEAWSGATPEPRALVLRVNPADDSVTIIAGSNLDSGASNVGYAGDGGRAREALLDGPADIAFAANGDLYVADATNNRVRRIVASGGTVSPDSTIELVAGSGQPGASGDGGDPRLGTLDRPQAVAIAADGTLYIGDLSARVRVIRPSSGGRVDPPTDVIDTLAGAPSNDAVDGRLSTELAIDDPEGLFLAPTGELWFADRSLQRVVRIGQEGIASVVAGSGGFDWQAGGFGGDNGPAVRARLNQPQDVVVDAAGNIFIADTGNHRIRRVDGQTGTITTYAGSGSGEDPGSDELALTPVPGQQPTPVYGGYAGNGGPASAAQLRLPSAVDIGPDGDLYIVDYLNFRIRKVDATTQIISHVAGDGSDVWAGDVGTASTMPIGWVADIDFGPDGRLYAGAYLDDGGVVRHVIWRIDPVTDAIVKVGQIDATIDEMNGGAYIAGIAVDTFGDILVSTSMPPVAPQPSALDPQEIVWKLTPGGLLEAIAGDASLSALIGDGRPASQAFFQAAGRLATDALNNWYISEGGGIKRIRGVEASTGVITSRVGWLWPGDGRLATQAGDPDYIELGSPRSMTYVSSLQSWLIHDGNGVPLASPNSATLRRLSFNTQRLDTVLGYLLGDTYIYPIGPPPFARGLRGAGGLAADEEAGVVYFTEPGFNLVYGLALEHPTNAELWQVEPLTGTVPDCRRNGGFADGALADACFDWPTDLVLDPMDRVLYVADSGNHVIRSIDVAGDDVQTVAGTPGVQGFGGDDGPANLATLNGPGGLAVYHAPATGLRYLYVADTGNHRVRRIDPDGTIQTVLGLGVADAVGDGEPASDLPVERPYGLSLDGYGNLFVTSTRTIRVVGAGADRLPGPEDRVVTIYGGDAVDLRSQTAARCLSDVEIDPTRESTVAYALDGCQGFFIRLTRRFSLDAGGPER